MLRKTTLPRLLLALALLAPSALARQASSGDSSADLERLRAHVAHLASDRLEGRKTGTRGAEEAAAYVATEFKRLGLEPGGDAKGTGSPARTYLQTFPYVAAATLGRANSLKFHTYVGSFSGLLRSAPRELRVGEDWMPLAFSASARVEDAQGLFLGYGVNAPELSHDDYGRVDVKGRVAVVLDGTPDGDNPHGRFGRYGDVRFKAAAARAAGAAALVIITRQGSFKDERLARLVYDNAGDAGLPVVVVSRQAGAALLGLGGPAKLAEFESSYQKTAAAGPAQEGPLSGFVTTSAEGLSLSLVTDVVRKSAPAANVVGVLEGSDPKLREEVIVVGAHYDHLGRGGAGSLAAREGDVHHGADDNASGTAALVELARLLTRDRAAMRRTVVFIAFGGEEEGLLGSKFYVEHPARPLARTVAMLNLDMVGRLKEDSLTIGGVGTAAEWRGLIEKVNAAASDAAPPPRGGGSAAPPAARRPFQLRLNEDGFGPSDHSSFYARQIPVLFFFTGTHEDYHKPSDTADRLNYDGLARVADLVRGLVSGLQDADARPTYTRAKVEASARATGFRVYLGTVPSYGDSADGMKLDGVRENSPAAAAGLKAGDVIVKLAGRDVRNVYDYTQALSEMKAGQEYEVEALRDGRRLTLKLTPAARR